MDWAWFFDLDGTLIEIASQPSRIVVHEDLPEILARLHRLTGGAVSLITGRRIEDLDSFLPLAGVPVAGQHGLEVRTNTGETTSHPVDTVQLERLRNELAEAVSRHPGLVVEFKGGSVALHYRMRPRLGGYANRLLRAAGAKHVPEFIIQRGKRVVELKPAAADKGDAVREMMTRHPFQGRTPLFIGDDLTDEAAFQAVNEMNGYSIKVGPGKTIAQYRLADVEAVRSWLTAGMDSVSFRARRRDVEPG